MGCISPRTSQEGLCSSVSPSWAEQGLERHGHSLGHPQPLGMTLHSCPAQLSITALTQTPAQRGNNSLSLTCAQSCHNSDKQLTC